MWLIIGSLQVWIAYPMHDVLQKRRGEEEARRDSAQEPQGIYKVQLTFKKNAKSDLNTNIALIKNSWGCKI